MSDIGANPLADLRAQIDQLDDALVNLLAQRFAVLDQVVAIKARDQLPAAIPARVAQVLAHVQAKAQAAGMPVELADAVWRVIIDWSIAYEHSQLKGEK